MSVLEKASELIDCLGHAGEPVSLAFVRSALDMPKSSTHRLLGELAGLGIVRRTEDGRYSLGPRLLYWGEAAAETFDLRVVAEPSMRRLRDAVGESVHLYLRDKDTRVCIAAVEARHELRPFIQLGRPLPLRAGAAGKLLLAFADDETQRLEIRRAKRRGDVSQRARRQARRGARADPRRALGHVGRGAGERRRGGGHADRRLARTRRRRAVHLGPDDAPRPGTHRGRTRATPAQRRRDQRAPPRRLRLSRRGRRRGIDSARRAVPVELAEQLLLARPVLGDRTAHPGHVHVVLEVDVLGRDVPAPRAAPEARRHRHPVVEGAGVRLRLRLADHDPAHRSDRASLSMWPSSNE